MKVMVISLLMLLLPLTSALEFNMSYPDPVTINEEFSIALSIDSPDTYDVKIFVKNSETGKTISEIFNSDWKNPYYYLKEAFPEKTEFSVIVRDQSENALICARLRKSGSTGYSEKCGIIKINGAVPDQSSEEASGEDNERPPEEEEAEPTTQETEPTTQEAEPTTQEAEPTTQEAEQIAIQDFVPSKEPEKDTSLDVSVESGPIRLNAKSSENKVFTTTEGKLRLFLAYSFTAFTILIVIFLIWKKL